jgi:hypothetical protein
MWLQQDGAPPHNANVVKNYLDERFPLRWVGTKGPLKWPLRSPALTPFDFFYNYIKHLVYAEQSTSLENLKERITTACKSVTQKMLKSVKC